VKAAKRDVDLVRFNNLVALVGTVTRCYCGKKGYLAKVGVRAEVLLRKRVYFAEWEHPKDDDCSSICEYVWP
jgi:hypothetical protein